MISDAQQQLAALAAETEQLALEIERAATVPCAEELFTLAYGRASSMVALIRLRLAWGEMSEVERAGYPAVQTACEARASAMEAALRRRLTRDTQPTTTPDGPVTVH